MLERTSTTIAARTKTSLRGSLMVTIEVPFAAGMGGPMDFGQSSRRQIRRRDRPPKGGGEVWKPYGRGGRNEAEKEGFEPSRQGFSPPNALAGRRLQPLGHFSASSTG